VSTGVAPCPRQPPRASRPDPRTHDQFSAPVRHRVWDRVHPRNAERAGTDTANARHRSFDDSREERHQRHLDVASHAGRQRKPRHGNGARQLMATGSMVVNSQSLSRSVTTTIETISTGLTTGRAISFSMGGSSRAPWRNSLTGRPEPERIPTARGSSNTSTPAGRASRGLSGSRCR
jgi:hypothetical protein